MTPLTQMVLPSYEDSGASGGIHTTNAFADPSGLSSAGERVKRPPHQEGPRRPTNRTSPNSPPPANVFITGPRTTYSFSSGHWSGPRRGFECFQASSQEIAPEQSSSAPVPQALTSMISATIASRMNRMTPPRWPLPAAIVRLGWAGVNATPAASSPCTARPSREAGRRRRRLAAGARSRALAGRAGRWGRCGVPRLRCEGGCQRRQCRAVAVGFKPAATYQ